MLGYLFGILITGLIVTTFATDCYKSKEELRTRMEQKIKGLVFAIEKDKKSHDYEVTTINNNISSIMKKMKKK